LYVSSVYKPMMDERTWARKRMPRPVLKGGRCCVSISF
jgi:hypothetical protein